MSHLALSVLLAASAAAPVPRAAPAPPELAAPVAYKDLMLVLVSKDGAAAVVFSDIDAKGSSLSYTFRYESADGKTVKTGKGNLFERLLPAGGYDPEGLCLSAGPIDLKWSMGSADRGWVYYRPETVAVHLAHAKNFEDKVQDLGHMKLEHKAVDLKRFMRK